MSTRKSSEYNRACMNYRVAFEEDEVSPDSGAAKPKIFNVNQLTVMKQKKVMVIVNVNVEQEIVF